MSDGRFAVATAVEASPAAADGRHRFGARIHEGWSIGDNANGGYLLAIAARAMAAATGRPPLTVTAHYLRPAPPGPCSVTVDVVRTGRRLATSTASLETDDGQILQLVGTFGSPDTEDDRVLVTAPRIELPDYDDCVERPMSAEAPALMGQLAVRVHPDDVGFWSGAPTGEPQVRGWFELLDGEPIDEFAVLLACDAFPPPVFNTSLPIAWVPTIELTVHLRRRPSPGPLRCMFRSRVVDGGMTDEDGEIIDSTGHVVARSRQLSLLPRTT